MRTNVEQEYEQKFLIVDQDNKREESRYYWDVVHSLQDRQRLGKYRIGTEVCKHRVYRYFDTFDQTLKSDGALAVYAKGSASDFSFIGQLEKKESSVSLRERPNLADCVLTVKIPTAMKNERIEHSLHLAPGTNFYGVDPNSFQSWAPLDELRRNVGGNMLQEVIRLYITTYRYDLQEVQKRKRVRIAEVAVDRVLAIDQVTNQVFFYELEVEQKEGKKKNVGEIVTLLRNSCSSRLELTYKPKWIEALEVLRRRTGQQDNHRRGSS